MKIERIVILVFTTLGVIAGIISSYLDSVSAIIVSLAILFVPVTIITRFFSGKKNQWFIQNSIITFVLVWLTVWILLYTR